MTLFISSKEPSHVKKLIPEAIPDMWPEDYGLDFAWVTPFGIGGIQRKEFPGDFLSSLSDERLQTLVLKMGDVTWRMIVLEGKPHWGTDGCLLGQFQGRGSIHIDRFQAMMWSIDYFHKIRCHWTSSLSETIAFVRRFYKWTMKEKHTQFCAEVEYPPNRDEKGNRVKIDWREWCIQHLPDIGQATARKIIQYEPEPLRWWNDGMDLEKVPGIGKKTADSLRRSLKKP